MSEKQRIDELVSIALACTAAGEHIFLYRVDLYGTHEAPLDAVILDAILQSHSYALLACCNACCCCHAYVIASGVVWACSAVLLWCQSTAADQRRQMDEC